MRYKGYICYRSSDTICIFYLEVFENLVDIGFLRQTELVSPLILLMSEFDAEVIGCRSKICYFELSLKLNFQLVNGFLILPYN